MRVDAREGDHHVGVFGGRLGDLLVRDRRHARSRLPVDGEHDRHHVCARGSTLRPRRASTPGRPLGTSRRRRASGRIVSCPSRETLGVHVDVDRDDGGEVDHGAGTLPARPAGRHRPPAGPSRCRRLRSGETLTGSPLSFADTGREARLRGSPSSPSSGSARSPRSP